ncbi:hypothetical protein [Streptococcus mutans]|nr:hypothetical protein [Streptococcus mutans]
MKNNLEEAAEAGDVQKTTSIRSTVMLEDLQENIDEGEYLVRYLHTLVITAQSLEQLKTEYEILYTMLGKMGVGIVRANADQLYLMYKNRMTEV